MRKQGGLRFGAQPGNGAQCETGNTMASFGLLLQHTPAGLGVGPCRFSHVKRLIFFRNIDSAPFMSATLTKNARVSTQTARRLAPPGASELDLVVAALVRRKAGDGDEVDADCAEAARRRAE